MGGKVRERGQTNRWNSCYNIPTLDLVQNGGFSYLKLNMRKAKKKERKRKEKEEKKKKEDRRRQEELNGITNQLRQDQE